MASHSAKIIWQRNNNQVFIDNNYSRAHQWQFDGGAIIDASPSPHIVPLPYSVAEHVDPEEAFIAALSSCHMLFFLEIAAKRKFVVNKYIDQAQGEMGSNSDKKIMMTKVTLHPYTEFSVDKIPSFSQLEKMHHQAHEQCFIANSVTTQVITEIVTELA